MSALLEVENLSLTVPTGHVIQGRKPVLNNVSFKIMKGKATAYLGPNGAGKTSTFRILCGLARKDNGSILFDGQPVHRCLPAKNLGFMPEQPYFYKNLTPYELLCGLGRLSGIHEKELPSRINTWAVKLDFNHILHQPMSACSKGQVQRVGIAQALIHQPDFILLDEPLSGLDPLGRELVRNVLRESVNYGATLLFSSHILADAESICDQVIVLNHGVVAFEGGMEDLTVSDKKWHITFEGELTPDIDIKYEQLRENQYRITVADLRDRDHAIQCILASSKATLLTIEPEKQTLEDAFIKLLAKDTSL